MFKPRLEQLWDQDNFFEIGDISGHSEILIAPDLHENNIFIIYKTKVCCV